MPDLELRKLWMLHLVDKQLLDIRRRAAALDPGRKLQGEIANLSEEHDAKQAHYKALTSEQTDIELQQKSIDDKIKRIDKDLYGGKVINPREVENLQKEIRTLTNHRGDLDVRILELWDAIPPAKKEADSSGEEVAVKRRELDEVRKKVLAAKTQLEGEFKERSEKRPVLAKEVAPALLSRYEVLRQKHEGIGMAGISKKNTCEACGTNLPTKTVESAKEGKLVTCEACHRLLYFTEGLI